MIEFSHSKGPWIEIDTGFPEGEIGDTNGATIATFKAASIGPSSPCRKNLERILACVNACDRAGWDNDVLDGDVIESLIMSCRMAKDVLQEHAYIPEIRLIIDTISDTLAKATGEEG